MALAFEKDAKAQLENGVTAAGTRARKASLEIEKANESFFKASWKLRSKRRKARKCCERLPIIIGGLFCFERFYYYIWHDRKMDERVLGKLKILAESAKYDVLPSSGTVRSNKAGTLGNTVGGWGICHSFAEDGRCISLLKVMLTNYCIYDCAYCINRRSNDLPRATLSVTELVELTMEFYRNVSKDCFWVVVVRNPTTWWNGWCVAKDLCVWFIVLTVAIFIWKSIPGASRELVNEAGLYADRLSVNVEIPKEENLKMLAPEKISGECLCADAIHSTGSFRKFGGT